MGNYTKTDLVPSLTAQISVEAWMKPLDIGGERPPCERTDEDNAIIRRLIEKRLRQHFMTHDDRDVIYNQVLSIAWDYHNSGRGWKAPWHWHRARTHVKLEVRRDDIRAHVS